MSKRPLRSRSGPTVHPHLDGARPPDLLVRIWFRSQRGEGIKHNADGKIKRSISLPGSYRLSELLVRANEAFLMQKLTAQDGHPF
jgi:hypothetical protein